MSLRTDICRFDGNEFTLWAWTDLYRSICLIPARYGVVPDYGRGTDAYRAIRLGLLVEDGQLFLDEIMINAVGEDYLPIADQLPEFPPGRSDDATYRNLKIPVIDSGVLVLLKDRVTFGRCVSGWFTPADFSQVRELEFIAGRLLGLTDDPDELLSQRNLMAKQALEPITRSNWKYLESFMRHDEIIEYPPESRKRFAEYLELSPEEQKKISETGSLLNYLGKHLPTRKPAWTECEIALVAEAAKGPIPTESAYELLAVVEKTSERFFETLGQLGSEVPIPPTFEITEPSPRPSALTLMTSDPDFALTAFVSDCPPQHQLMKFADIATAAPEGPGVYQLWHFYEGILKVGISTNLRARLKQHWRSRASALKLKPGGDPSNPADWVSKGSILAKHLFFDRTLGEQHDLTTEDSRRRFLEEHCEIAIYPTESVMIARELEKQLERSGRIRYQGRVKVR